MFTCARGSVGLPANAYIASNFQTTVGISTISNWLLTPPLTLKTGAQLSFWTRTTTPVRRHSQTVSKCA